MAYEVPGFSFTLPAGADFSPTAGGAQFRFCDVSSLGKAVNPTNGGSVVGVRYTRSRLNEAATIVHSGIAIVESAGAIATGALVSADATGRVQTAASGHVVVGRAFEASTASGIQIAVLLIPNTANAA